MRYVVYVYDHNLFVYSHVNRRLPCLRSEPCTLVGRFPGPVDGDGDVVGGTRRAWTAPESEVIWVSGSSGKLRMWT